ncbi:hypothetical protein D6C83_08953 [Aureobasidium pullulans]|uniref:Uncharacterized protein n=1 Tax=Aureobasidium pullulans TaxID=5580 RepID=A0A4S9Z6I0_AURPU|nr:hypothetical protein D6C83_08953 [Aureobasidium pullulans]
MPSTSSPASISSEDLWETATVVEEGQEDEHLLQKYGHFSSERTDKKTDHRATPTTNTVTFSYLLTLEKHL